MDAEFWRVIGQRVRRERTRQGITTAQLAAMVGLTRQALVRLETGVRGIRLEGLRDIARALKVDLSVLIPDMRRPDPATVDEQLQAALRYRGLAPSEIEQVFGFIRALEMAREGREALREEREAELRPRGEDEGV